MKNGIDCFMERFPQYGLSLLGIEVSQLNGMDALYISGIHPTLYFQYQEWLKGDPKRVLIFLEKEPSALAAFLNTPIAADIFSDPQVHFGFLSDLDALTRQFPFEKVAVIGSKALKLKILRKTALRYAERIDLLYGVELFENWVSNCKQIPNSFYANHMKGNFKDVPAIVCGAGPSLNIPDGLENKALIIAGGSTIAALSSRGIIPHFGLAFDPNFEEFKRFKNSFAFEMPLIYSTRVAPGIFQTCNGPFGYLRTGFGGIHELWMDEELGLSEPILGPFAKETNSVTAICIAWAQFLGCNPIILNGVDLSYTNNKRYAAGVVAKEEPITDAIISQNRSTAVRWVMEADSLAYLAKKTPQITFINTTQSGLPIKGIAAMPLDEVIKTRFTQTFDLKKRVHEQIIRFPMPCRELDLSKMKTSLERVVGCLKILCGEEKGSTVLAEMDMKEELAYSILFQMAENLFAPHEKWRSLYEIARKYRL